MAYGGVTVRLKKEGNDDGKKMRRRFKETHEKLRKADPHSDMTISIGAKKACHWNAQMKRVHLLSKDLFVTTNNSLYLKNYFPQGIGKDIRLVGLHFNFSSATISFVTLGK